MKRIASLALSAALAAGPVTTIAAGVTVATIAVTAAPAEAGPRHLCQFHNVQYRAADGTRRLAMFKVRLKGGIHVVDIYKDRRRGIYRTWVARKRVKC